MAHRGAKTRKKLAGMLPKQHHHGPDVGPGGTLAAEDLPEANASDHEWNVDKDTNDVKGLHNRLIQFENDPNQNAQNGCRAQNREKRRGAPDPEGESDLSRSDALSHLSADGLGQPAAPKGGGWSFGSDGRRHLLLVHANRAKCASFPQEPGCLEIPAGMANLAPGMIAPLQVTVWNEFRHEKTNPAVAALYPQGIHEAIAAPLRAQLGWSVRTATLDEPEHGLGEAALAATDVLIWWGHRAHGDVSDEIVARARRRVLEGMGLIVLHSGHYSKLFKALMGTTCSLQWRVANDKERLWTVQPSHPIAQGIGPYFEIPAEEMYGEPFGIPPPDELVFLSWFSGGEVFRSGCTWQRGHGRIFYFRPGHETYPSYHQKEVQRVIANAVAWARPTVRIPDYVGRAEPLEPLPPLPRL